MSIKKTHAVVLTADGQFCRIPASPALAIGMEVSWVADAMPLPDKEVQLGKAKRHWQPRLWQRYGMAGMAASLLVAAGIWFATNTLSPARAEAYAFVSMDINPSLLFQVDKNLKVVSFQGENQDGTTLLSSLNLKGMSLSNAVEQVVQKAASTNMLPAQDSILVATAPVNSSVSVNEIESQVEQDVNNAIQASPAAQSLKPTVYSLGLSNAVWEAASNAKIAPAKLATYLVARDEGFNLTVSQLSGDTLKQVFAHPSAAAMNALSSDNPNVVKTWINEMEQSGLLSSPVTKLVTTHSVPANHVTPPGSTSHNSPPPAPKGPSGGGQSVPNITIPSVTVKLGGTSFRVQIGNEGQGGSHKKPKKDKGFLPDKTQGNHNPHKDKGGGESLNQAVGTLSNNLQTSQTGALSPQSSGDSSASLENSGGTSSGSSSTIGSSGGNEEFKGSTTGSENSFRRLAQGELNNLENRLLNAINKTSLR